ncbi:hypothetical protein MNBD_NITROSPIRAE02-1676, partial [hydrothermal vent metagenome]
GVEELEVLFAGNTKDVFHSLSFKTPDKELRNLHADIIAKTGAA